MGLAGAQASETDRFKRFFQECWLKAWTCCRRNLKPWFVSLAHSTCRSREADRGFEESF